MLLRTIVAYASLGCGLSLAGLAAGCGDDDAGAAEAGTGCTTDVECKGDRICVDRECVDPAGADERDAAAGGEGGGSGARDRDAGAGAGSGGGDGGDSGSGSGSGGGGRASPMIVDDPELEEACSLNCEARHGAACSMNIGSLDQCLGQCLIVDEINVHCHDQQRAQYACLASGGYSCVSDYPQQRSTCIAENQALSECLRLAPCRTYCESAAGDCAPSGDDCLDDCRAMEASFDDALCGIYFAQLLTCRGQGVACEDGRPAVEACRTQVAQVADCVGSRNHECDGYCWAAEQLGCGAEDCVANCRLQADETTCGHYYRNLLDCALQRTLQLSCEDGEPTPSSTECSSQLMQYTTCMM